MPQSNTSGLKTGNTLSVDFQYNFSKDITKLSLSNSNVCQEILDNLSKYLQTEECVVSELVFDGIDLSNLNFLCCIKPNSKIKKLWMRRCKLKDKRLNDLMTVLDETNGKTHLNLLYLDCNGITCEGAKQIAQVLRTNRTLQSLSLASNSIKDEGVLSLLNVLSKFSLNEHETKLKLIHEQKRTKLIEFLIDIISLKLEEKQRNNILNSTVESEVMSVEDNDLKQIAEDALIPESHPYLTDQLLKSESSFYCPGNFKISYMNISYNRCSSNVLSIIDQVLQYQQKVCLAEEGIKVLIIEGFKKNK